MTKHRARAVGCPPYSPRPLFFIYTFIYLFRKDTRNENGRKKSISANEATRFYIYVSARYLYVCDWIFRRIALCKNECRLRASETVKRVAVEPRKKQPHSEFVRKTSFVLGLVTHCEENFQRRKKFTKIYRDDGAVDALYTASHRPRCSAVVFYPRRVAKTLR